MASSLRLGAWLIGLAIGMVGCADALRLEPPSGTGQGGSTVTGPAGSGGGTALSCNSSSDCPEPTGVCDTVQHNCVQCLSFSDCGFKPGTVCSKGKCACPGGYEFCGANKCVDLKVAQDNCGKCKHACFGACSAGACNDPWEPVASEGAPAARSNHVAVWATESNVMIVWGGIGPGGGNGATNTGGIYNPATFSWTPTTAAGAPTARYNATAVWTGKEMLVWGGQDSTNAYLSDGGRFDPVTNVWKPISNAGSPGPRAFHVAVWDPKAGEMIVWGGSDSSNELATGGRYRPDMDAWTSIQDNPQPNASRSRACGLWDSKLNAFFIYGGFGDDISNTVNNKFFPDGAVPGGVVYQPSGMPAWTGLQTVAQPSSRADCTAVFDGDKRYFVFGGISDNSSGYLNSGAQWDGAMWSAFNGAAPTARRDHTAVFVSKVKYMIVFGGRNASPLDTGMALDTTMNTWKSELPRVLSPRYGHTAVSTGDKMIVWGGQGSGKLNDGGIYTP